MRALCARMSPERRLAVISIVCAAMIVTSLSGCGSGGTGTQISLTLFNGQHVQTTDSLVSGFERETGIHVVVESDDEDTLANEIDAQRGASPADLIYTENTPALEYLQNQHLLAPVAPSTLARIPTRFNSPDRDWIGVSARISVMVYSPHLISARSLPSTLLQVAASRYAGKVAIAPTETDFQPVITALDRKVGPRRTLRWLEALRANAGGHVYDDNEAITSAVNRGAVAFGIVNQYYWYRLRAEIGARNVHSRIADFAPHDPGFVLDVSGGAVLKSSHQQAAAQRFLAYLVSRAGQERIVHSISFEYPIAPGIAAAASEPPFTTLKPDNISLSQIGDGSTAIRLLSTSGLL